MEADFMSGIRHNKVRNGAREMTQKLGRTVRLYLQVRCHTVAPYDLIHGNHFESCQRIVQKQNYRYSNADQCLQ